MDLTARNTKQLILINGVTAATALKTTGQVSTYTDLSDGQMAVTEPSGTVVSDGFGTLGGLFRIVTRNGNNLYWTPVLSASRSTVYPYVAKAVGKQYNLPVQQVSYVGYNYTSGAIQVINSNVYKLWIKMKELSAVGQGSDITKPGVYESTTSDTQSNIAYELTKNLIDNWKTEPWKDIYFGRVYSGGVTLINGNADYVNWTVTQGSRTISCVNADLTATLTVGSYINLAGLVFIITASSYDGGTTNNVQLDIPWQHPSGVCIASDVTVARVADTSAGTTNVVLSANHGITAGTTIYIGIANNGQAAGLAQFYSGIAGGTTPATDITLDKVYAGTANANCVIGGGMAAAGGNWGIRFEGAPRTQYFNLGLVPYSIPMFDVYVDDCGTTAVTNSVSPTWGCQTGYQIAEEELFCQGFEKGNFTDRKDWLNSDRKHAVESYVYDTITLIVKDEKALSSITGQPTSQSEIVIAARGDGSQTSINAIEAVLDDFLGNITIQA